MLAYIKSIYQRMNNMNEWKIGKLAEIAEDRVKSRPNGTYDTRKFNIVFAEMLVAICIDLVEEGVDHREPASTYADRIREHFGMELTDE
jgi:hypothetical protein